MHGHGTGFRCRIRSSRRIQEGEKARHFRPSPFDQERCHIFPPGHEGVRNSRSGGAGTDRGGDRETFPEQFLPDRSSRCTQGEGGDRLRDLRGDEPHVHRRHEQAAREAGFACTVIEDACATRDLVFRGETIPAGSVHAAFMAALNGSYARVTALEEYLSG